MGAGVYPRAARTDEASSCIPDGEGHVQASVIPFSVLDLAPIVEGGDAAQALSQLRSISRATRSAGATAASGSRSTTTCPASPAPRPRSRSPTSPPAPRRSGSARAGSCSRTTRRWSSPSSSARSTRSTPGGSISGSAARPGPTQLTAHALRRTLVGDVDRFPDDVVELLGYFRPPEPGQRVRAIPGRRRGRVEVWILGSSLFGAELAGALGLPYAFASHFAPGLLMEAIDVYRRGFRPRTRHARPHLMLGRQRRRRRDRRRGPTCC